MKRLLKYTFIVLMTLAGLYILWSFRVILLLFFFSLFAAAAIRPFVAWLAKRGIPTAAGLVLLYTVSAGVILLALFLIGERLLLEANMAANEAVLEYEGLHRDWQEGASWQRTAVETFLPPLPYATTIQSSDLEEVLPEVVAFGRSLLSVGGSLLLLLALSVYWSVDQYRFERLWLSLLPAAHRAFARKSWRDIEETVSGYLRVQTVQSMLAALFLGGAALLSGLSFPLLLAAFGAIATFVPLFGGVATAVVAFMLGSLTSYSMGAAAALYTIFLFLGLELMVEPRLWPQERRSFLLTILVILPLLDAFGIVGLIVAPPLALVFEVIIRQTYRVYVRRQDTGVQLEDLETRYRQLKQNISQAENGSVMPELENLTERLGDLLSDSRDSLSRTHR